MSILPGERLGSSPASAAATARATDLRRHGMARGHNIAVPTEIPGLLLVHGDEAYLVDRTVENWRASATGDVEVIDALAKLEPLIASLVDVPLFAAERHVLVRDLPQLSGSRKGNMGVDELVRGLSMRAPSTRLCLAVRATVAPANQILAAVQAQGGRVVHHSLLRPSERRHWLERELRSRKVVLPPGGAELLLRCSGGDLGAVAGELDKIAAHGERLNIEQLVQLVAGTEQLQLYNVLDLLGGPQPAAGAALLADLIAEGRSPQYLLSILAGQLRDLLMAHAVLLGGNRGASALAAAMRIPAWRAERVLRTTHAIPVTLAMAWMRELQRIDAGLKAGEVDDVAALQHWGLAAAQALLDRRTRGSA
jgi:DNA polymerase III delta subunit